MKRLLLASCAVSLLLGAIALSGGQKLVTGDVDADIEARNPWTHLRVNAEPGTFHFAVVSDRTGGHRARVFSQSVDQLNLMQPAFVVSVGDLIEGYTKEKTKVVDEWKEFDSYVSKLQMPFFYVPGNHDLSNPMQVENWQERYGRRYYHFLYQGVLFLAVNSDDPGENKEPQLSPEQVDYFKRVLAANPRPRWTIVMVHKPMWVFKNIDTNGWLAFEKLLDGRQYTVFAGHVHRYQKFVRQGQNYYQLATTGGSSKMRGLRYGEFDHITWVTMKKDGPVMANLLLDGIFTEDMRRPHSEEVGVPTKNRKPVHAVRGRVIYQGKPVDRALVAFYVPDVKDKTKLNRIADALTEEDGSYVLSTYTANDGAPVGEYIVSVVQRDDPYLPETKEQPNRLPEQYGVPAKTPLRALVAEGPNEVNLELSR